MVQAAPNGLPLFLRTNRRFVWTGLNKKTGRRREESAGDFLFVSCRTCGARRTPSTVAEVSNFDVQFLNRAAEGIAMHAQLPRGPALIAFVFFQHYRDKPALKFAHGLGIKNIAAVHLLYQCF